MFTTIQKHTTVEIIFKETIRSFIDKYNIISCDDVSILNPIEIS